MAVSNDIGQNVGVVANRKQCLGWLAIGWISAVIFTATAIGKMSEPSGDDYWVRPIVVSIFKWWKTRLIAFRKGIGGLAITAALTGFGYRLITAAETVRTSALAIT